MDETDLITYYEVEEYPTENWFRLDLPFPKLSDDLFTSRYDYLTYAKKLMTELGYKQNVDYRLDTYAYSKHISLYLSPEIEKYASWIGLNWRPR